MAPTAVCQNFTVALDGNGDAFITGADVAPNSSDNCTINEVKVDPDEFDCTSVGQHTVDVIVFDGEGNTDNCQAVVTVDDSGPTFSNCPGDILSMNDLGNCNGPVFWFEPTAIDNCGLVASITSTHSPNDIFPVGITQVILSLIHI